MRRDELRVAAGVLPAVLLLDMSWRSYFFNFDGVACAIAVELKDFRHLVHGNHLAYGVLGWLFDAALRGFGYRGGALWSLQLLDGLLGAAGAAAFASILIRAGRTTREAALAAAALAVSQAWWFWSLEAQVYMLGALFAALAAREVLGENPRPAVAGALAAAAALGHVGHLMAVPALLWLLSRRKPASTRAFLLSLTGVLIAAYLAAGALAVRPSGARDVRLWLLGSAALNTKRSFLWHGAAPPAALKSWSLMTLRIFCEFTGLPGVIKAAGVVLALLPLAAAARAARRGGETARFWTLWLAGYAALYLCWEPYTIVYRIGDLIGLWALADMGLDALPEAARAWSLSAWIAAAGFYNWRAQIAPNADPAANADYAEALWTAERTPADAWALAVGRGQVYLPYFAHRRPLNPLYWPGASLEARLDALAASGQPVFATDRALAASEREPELRAYGVEPAASSDGLTLYRVRREANPTAEAGKD